MKTTITKVSLYILAILFFGQNHTAFAAADRQAFAGGGIGIEFLSKNGSGTGFYLQGAGGYAFTPNLGAGLHLGYSNIGSVGIKMLDFGAFGQVMEPESGFYGRLYLDGIYASVSGGGRRNGVDGDEMGFAPGAGIGLLIPAVGDFHLNPEVAYKYAFLSDGVNLLQATFNLMWDF
jgi:hypothetical protein